MKKSLFFTLLLVFTFITTNAQQMGRENITLLKTSYITDALSLTPTEAEKFWPVYNLYNNKIKTSKQKLEFEMRNIMNYSGGIDDLSEEKALVLVNQMLQMEEDISKNKTKMTHELLKILPAKKVIKLEKAERDFNRRILQEYGKRKRMGAN
ncbi:sensor of ECF-type sigma factor [Lutibacter sp. HS1-25]|uniref:sensor of ECF-type sigma factor n=1 Tax=Lutibacter sp. HS1-25 TaxID=2485000 RepID=UPI00101353A9|nr:sensor of ECF-type sigma factor [Lutibacter sp. HS1-25]